MKKYTTTILIVLTFAIGVVVGSRYAYTSAVKTATRGTVLTDLTFLNNIHQDLQSANYEAAKTSVEEAVAHRVSVLRMIENRSDSSLMNEFDLSAKNFDNDSKFVLKRTSDNFLGKSKVFSQEDSQYLSAQASKS